MIEITAANSTPYGGSSNSSVTSDRDRLVGDFDTFLNVLTTQLAHQDPLDPMDTTEFTNQLVQFAGVEQQLAQADALENIANKLEQTQASYAVNLIGKQVGVPSTSFELDNRSGEFHYELPEDVASATLELRDSSGATVYSSDLTPEGGTRNIVTWDGQTPSDTPGGLPILNPDGLYQVVIVSRDASQNVVPSDVYGFLSVDNIGFANGEASFNLRNGKTVGWDQINSVR